MLQTGFIGGSCRARQRWMGEEIGLARSFGTPCMVFFWDEKDLARAYRLGCPVYAPGYGKSVPVDIALEYSTGSAADGGSIEAGNTFAEALIPEHEIRDVRDKFWPQSARTILAHLYSVAIRRWKSAAEKGFCQERFPSVTYLLKTMVTDISLCRGNGTAKRYPQWWEEVGDSSRNVLETLAISNAATTSGSIFAEISSFMAGMDRVTSRECVPPVLCSMASPLYVHAKALGERGIPLFLHAMASNHPDGAIFVLEAQSWPARMIEALFEVYRGYSGEMSCTLSSSSGALGGASRDVLSGNTIWGHSKDPSVKGLFSQLVRNTLGSEAGIVASLPYEEPSALPGDLDAIRYLNDRGWEVHLLSFQGPRQDPMDFGEILGERVSGRSRAGAGNMARFLMEIFGREPLQDPWAFQQPSPAAGSRDGPSGGGEDEAGEARRLEEQADLIQELMDIDDLPDTDEEAF